jgi:hypothetical protein
MTEHMQRMVVLHKLYVCLNNHAQAMGDMSLAAAGLLVDIIERGGRATRADLDSFSGAEAAAAINSRLESLELVERTRGTVDRRTFVFRATDRGVARATATDEALSTALVDMSGRLTEETFNRLEELLGAFPSAGSTDRVVTTLLPASILGSLCRYHNTFEKACAIEGVTCTQVALLGLLEHTLQPVSAPAAAARLAMPTAPVLLQLEMMADRGIIVQQGASGNGGYVMTDVGGRKLSAVLGDMRRQEAQVDLLAEHVPSVEELLEYCIYLFGGSTIDRIEEDVGAAKTKSMGHVEATAELCSMLSEAFSYPNRPEAEQRTSPEFVAALQRALASADIFEQLDGRVYADALAATALPAEQRAVDVRVEYTRLFYASPHIVSLNGSDWVRRGMQEFARAHGERAAVGLAYHDLGLKNRRDVNVPFDNLVSELDYLSYVAHSEAAAINAGDAGSAREWERLRDDFAQHHFIELAKGVAQGVAENSGNPFLRLFAETLGAFAQHL